MPPRATSKKEKEAIIAKEANCRLSDQIVMVQDTWCRLNMVKSKGVWGNLVDNTASLTSRAQLNFIGLEIP